MRIGVLISLLISWGCQQDTLVYPTASPPSHQASWVDVSASPQANQKIMTVSSLNVTTIIEFYVQSPAVVSMTIYDGGSVEIMRLLDRVEMDEGYQDVEFDASGLSTGVYIYKLTEENLSPDGIRTGAVFTESRKMMLIK
jgi:hypothetical protein